MFETVFMLSGWIAYRKDELLSRTGGSFFDSQTIDRVVVDHYFFDVLF